MNIITAALLCLLSTSSMSRVVVSFQPIRANLVRSSRLDTTTATSTITTATPSQDSMLFMRRTSTSATATRLLAVSESGIETGVIKGIQEDSAEIDFGRCGVKLAEETAVRMSGQVLMNTNNNNNNNNGGGPAATAVTAEWSSLDNILKLSPIDMEQRDGVGFTILATASAVEEYKDPGQGTVKEVLYAPDECAKAILNQIQTVNNAPRIVINVAGGNDLQIAEVMDAVVKLSTAFKNNNNDNNDNNNNDAQIVWNSLAFKDFPLGAATMVVVAMEQKLDSTDDMLTEPLSGLAAGEIYQQNGNFFTVDEKDIITDFSEDWML
jgi:hypothetical protein